MCCKPSPFARFFTALLIGAGIGFVVYNLLDDEHKRVIRYLGKQVKYLPDRYML
jgi:hypothetical protein